ncbi:MAG: alanine dehydrogenase [Candidatus Schekmanbacteria bacterium]|nr:MAG: alanine dehydrogenase [Candidatus Schekmanbacteria bacterium]
MIVGIPKEIKDHEYRVGIVPSGVRTLAEAGIKVIVEKSAGIGSNIPDNEYEESGAEIVESAKEVYEKSDMIIKVKEPLEEEYDYLREDLILYTFLHLASSRSLTEELLKRKVTAIGYETIQLENGLLPLLTPMSEIAGKLSVQVGASFLEKERGGRGVLLGGVPGVLPGKVIIIGGGTAGINAAKIACGMGAEVTVLDIKQEKMAYIEDIFGSRIFTLISNSKNIEEKAAEADLLIGAVLIPGKKAPKIIPREVIKKMKEGSVFVDISVDQGGCAETTKPTTHSNPVFKEEGVIHYCVTNIPSAVACTSTYALTNVTLPYALKIAKEGFRNAVSNDKALAKGVNTYQGKLVCQAVAESFEMEFSPLNSLIQF